MYGPHYTLGRKCCAVSDMMGVLGRALQLTTDEERSAVNTLELVWIAMRGLSLAVGTMRHQGNPGIAATAAPAAASHRRQLAMVAAAVTMQQTFRALFPSLAPSRNAKVRPWRPTKGCQDGLVVIR
eukprot:scaffold2378_cov39-Phaeocystis_antarctica.AAC.1